MTVAQPMRRPVEATPATRLRSLAGRIRRLAVSGRLDPEAIFSEKEQIVVELCRIAREIDHA